MTSACLLLLLVSAYPVANADSAAAAPSSAPDIRIPATRLQAAQLGVVVNTNDPQSIAIGDYYILKRHIPRDNLIRVALPVRPSIGRDEFRALQLALKKNTPTSVQAYALAWTKPYRVDCMSVTSAIAFGYDKQLCSAKRCGATKRNPLFNSNSHRPYTDHGIRPAMMLAADSVVMAKQLIDRGIRADQSFPDGTAYLVKTSDQARSIRAIGFPQAARLLGDYINIELVEGDAIHDKDDVLFYFTGKTFVDDLKTNTYLPGAIADHLTSAGGRLDGSKQMSSLEWLRAGATGSYGTVVEPCNLLAKFPDPIQVMGQYYSGNTLIEAYWKSVQMPGEGVFIGEPLASPFGGYRINQRDGNTILESQAIRPGLYTLYGAVSGVGPYQIIKDNIQMRFGPQQISLGKLSLAHYRLIRNISVAPRYQSILLPGE
ncbi:MAG: hypothetical protein BMS9Abin26_0220 [Gammaproteobacteria bacterium]|nr:MAG: hypothetical protein BMS9Abin26_0220 [Gammaproteobacteria bacterium]